MTQIARPLTGVKWTDLEWRDAQADARGIAEDYTGESYALFLPTDSNAARIGTNVQASHAHLMGFGHTIPAGAYETLDIPTTSGAARTDLIVLRYNPAWAATTPGAVRLTRVAGVSSSTGYNGSPSVLGEVDLPLYAITRQPNQNLSDATVVDLRQWKVTEARAGAAAPLPPSAPIGARFWRGPTLYSDRVKPGAGQAVNWQSPRQSGLWFLASSRFTRYATPVQDNGQRNLFWFDIPDQGAGIWTIRTRVEFTLQSRVRADLQLYAGNQVALPLLRDVAIMDKRSGGASTAEDYLMIINPLVVSQFSWSGGPLRVVCAAQRISAYSAAAGWVNSQFNGWCEVSFQPQPTSVATALNNSNS